MVCFHLYLVFEQKKIGYSKLYPMKIFAKHCYMPTNSFMRKVSAKLRQMFVTFLTNRYCLTHGHNPLGSCGMEPIP